MTGGTGTAPTLVLRLREPPALEFRECPGSSGCGLSFNGKTTLTRAARPGASRSTDSARARWLHLHGDATARRRGRADPQFAKRGHMPPALFVGQGFEIHRAVQGFKLGILVDQNCAQLAGDPSDQRIGQSRSEKRADVSSRKGLRSTLPILLALLEKALQKSLSLGRAAKGGNRICRHGDHADDFSFVDPYKTISLVDLISLADRRRDIRLAFLGDRGLHRVLLGIHNLARSGLPLQGTQPVLQGKGCPVHVGMKRPR